MNKTSGGAAASADPGAGISRPSSYARAGYGLVIVVLWLAAHPYVGIIHDARFYTVQALNSGGGAFASDLFFAYGSQDSFTAFTALYRLLVGVAGPGHAHAIASALGQALWLGALVALIRSLFANDVERLAAIVAVVLFDRSYGASGVFTYSETFVTPRLYAEGLVLAAAALTLRRRYLFAAAALAIASAMHPLMGLTGVAVIAANVLLRRKRAWLLVAAGVLVLLLLAGSGVEPFGRILKRFDPAWMAIVEQRSSYAFLARWSWTDWLHLAAAISSLAGFCLVATARERRLAAAVLVVSVGGVLVSYLGGDLAKNVLVMNVQPWRALWLAAVFGNAAVALILVRAPRTYVSREFFLIGAVLAVLGEILLIPRFVGAGVLVAAAAVLALETRMARPIGRWLATPLRIGVCLGVVLVGYFAVQHLQSPGAQPAFTRLLVTGGALAAIPLLSVSPPVLFGLVILAALSLQLWNVDQRSAWQKFLEAPGAPASLQTLPIGRNTYWEAGMELLWIKLKRPSYYSCAQGTGVMFFRDTAMEYERRGEGLRGLDTYDFRDSRGELCATKRRPGRHGPDNRADLVEACRSLPDLDTLVLSKNVPAATPLAWRPPVPRQLRLTTFGTADVSTFYVYDCRALRRP